jgi:hypothetical protein
LGNLLGTNSLSVNEPGPGESGRVQQILNDEFEQPAKELVLVQSLSLTATSAGLHAPVRDVTRWPEAQPNVTNVESPFAAGNAGRISSDRHSALVQFDIRRKSEDAADKVAPILATVAKAQSAHPQFTIEEFGGGSVNKGISDQFGKDLLKAGVLSLPVTLGILLLRAGDGVWLSYATSRRECARETPVGRPRDRWADLLGCASSCLSTAAVQGSCLEPLWRQAP